MWKFQFGCLLLSYFKNPQDSHLNIYIESQWLRIQTLRPNSCLMVPIFVQDVRHFKKLKEREMMKALLLILVAAAAVLCQPYCLDLTSLPVGLWTCSNGEKIYVPEQDGTSSEADLSHFIPGYVGISVFALSLNSRLHSISFLLKCLLEPFSVVRYLTNSFRCVVSSFTNVLDPGFTFLLFPFFTLQIPSFFFP